MDSEEFDRDEAAREVTLTDRVGDWLRRAGVADGEELADLAVGFIDTLAAAEQARLELAFLLTCDPTSAVGAGAALAALGRLHAQLFDEMKHHMADLERRWDSLEKLLAARIPDVVSESP